jgi:hypothetical protein
VDFLSTYLKRKKPIATQMFGAKSNVGGAKKLTT